MTLAAFGKVFLIISNIQVALLFFFANNIESMIIIIACTTSLLGIVGYIFTGHFMRTYDPNVVDNMLDLGRGLPEKLNIRRKK